MLKLRRYLKNYKFHLTVGPLCKLIEAIFELIVPLVMADIIDNGLNGANASVGYILGRGGIMVALGVAGLGFSLICQYVASRCSQGFGTTLRSDLFRHIHSLSFAELDRIGTPSMITRMTSDIDQLQVAVAMLIRLVIRAPFLVVGSVVMTIAINPKLALVLVAVAPLIALALWAIMSATIPRYGKIQSKLDQVSDVARENLTGIRVVRAFSKQQTETRRFDDATQDLARSSIVVGRISALLNPITFVVINLAIVAILYFGGDLVDTGAMTQGEITAFVNYLMQISLALVVVANLIILYTKSAASAKRIREVFGMQSSIRQPRQDAPPAPAQDAPKLEFEDVSFGYGGKTALRDLTLQVYAGETIGVIGGTGSGKSTLIHLIPRFYDAAQGCVKLDGADVRSYPLRDLRAHVGLVPQQSRLFAGTIRSNLLWGNPDADEATLDWALEVAQAKEFVYAKPEGLDTPVNQGGKNFSGGQRQRLTIARALVGKPDILILDDSMSALDFATDLALRNALARELPDTTKIFVSQRATSLRHADKIVVLDHGDVAGIGTHETLLDTCEIYREIWNSQQSEQEAQA